MPGRKPLRLSTEGDGPPKGFFETIMDAASAYPVITGLIVFGTLLGAAAIIGIHSPAVWFVCFLQ